jgi:hypothetical protein
MMYWMAPWGAMVGRIFLIPRGAKRRACWLQRQSLSLRDLEFDMEQS